MRITAVAATLLDDFEPSSWTRLPDSDTDRILITDGDRSLVVTVAAHDRAAAAHAEHVAATALAPLLPADAPRIPHILAARTIEGEIVGHDADVTLTIADPMPGLPLSTAMFEEQPALVESLARTIALIHSADAGPIADAGLTVEESAETRDRLLADLDSAAATGRVPSSLLSRWETALEEVTAWRFLPVPVHASLGPDALWAIDGEIVAVSELARLRVGDPAMDLAAVSSMLSPEDFQRFFRAYRAHRDPDDPGLRRRVGFHAEITVLEWLLAAVAAQDDAAIDDAADLLEALAEVTDDSDGLGDDPHDGDSPSTEAPETSAPAEDLPHAPEDPTHTAEDFTAEPDDHPHDTDDHTHDTADLSHDTEELPDGENPEVFLPSARIGAGIDEDAIATERLDTSELHVHDPREDDESPEDQEPPTA